MEHDIVRYLESKGYRARAIGSIYRTVCPFPDHHETKASFTLYPDANAFHCFGCKQTGSLLKLMQLFGDPIPQELIDAENERRRLKKYNINPVQTNRLCKARSILTRIRNARKRRTDQSILNARTTYITNLIKELIS